MATRDFILGARARLGRLLASLGLGTAGGSPPVPVFPGGPCYDADVTTGPTYAAAVATDETYASDVATDGVWTQDVTAGPTYAAAIATDGVYSAEVWDVC